MPEPADATEPAIYIVLEVCIGLAFLVGSVFNSILITVFFRRRGFRTSISNRWVYFYQGILIKLIVIFYSSVYFVDKLYECISHVTIDIRVVFHAQIFFTLKISDEYKLRRDSLYARTRLAQRESICFVKFFSSTGLHLTLQYARNFLRGNTFMSHKTPSRHVQLSKKHVSCLAPPPKTKSCSKNKSLWFKRTNVSWR